MALRLSTVRLLIADDVGIGKTIEAGMILRELIDRGEADRFSVLCPPHLTEQWTGELARMFDIDAVAVTSASAARLERGLPPSTTLFDAHPFTVVSLDYIKADRRRESFTRSCPRLVVVDEAHACVGTHLGRQQRFELLTRLAADAERHLILLTATPHSGDEHAFDRLLGLVGKDFSGASLDNDAGRARLARHFVQRRRIDVTGPEWNEERTFPKHNTAESTYRLGKVHQAFHDTVLDYCLGVVQGAGEGARQRRLAFWGTLALMRCVGSSPAAALSALRNRLGVDDRLEEQVFDEDDDDSDAIDIEPSTSLTETKALLGLIEQAQTLTTAADPKLDATIKALKPLLVGGANPVVFCRFLATAEHVAAGLKKAFPKVHVEAVTGALTPEERRARVEAMGDKAQRLLVATDCLSEGINLQMLFDAVVHYDLSWNPTRHQQREGRVDRFGQPSRSVHSILLFSPDSAIDGAVLDVILRKAEAIRTATGVTVPLPEEKNAVSGALMNAVLLHRGRSNQLAFDLSFGGDAKAIDVMWRDAEEGEKRSRARFAQNALKPAEVAPEWQRWRNVMGTPEEVRRFVSRAMSRLAAPLEPAKSGLRAHLGSLPLGLRERLEARGLEDTVRIAFEEPAPAGCQSVTRNHTLTATLADGLLEGALDSRADTALRLGRAGAWTTAAVTERTVVALLRIRHKLLVRGRRERLLLAEEADVLAFAGAATQPSATGDTVRALLEVEASGNLADVARDRQLAQARTQMEALLPTALAAHAQQRAQALADDHARVRVAIAGAPRVEVEPVLPVDVIGLFVLLPEAR